MRSLIERGVEALPQVNAVLQSFLPGPHGGAALADALVGTFEPSGRLPISWPTAASSTVDMCIRAREQLLKAGHSQVLSFNRASRESTAKVFNSDESIPGLGDNYLTEKARQKGIRAYSDMIQGPLFAGFCIK